MLTSGCNTFDPWISVEFLRFNVPYTRWGLVFQYQFLILKSPLVLLSDCENQIFVSSNLPMENPMDAAMDGNHRGFCRSIRTLHSWAAFTSARPRSQCRSTRLGVCIRRCRSRELGEFLSKNIVIKSRWP